MIIELDLYKFLHSPSVYVAAMYLAVNLFALVAMYRDKRKAINDERRIPEVKLLFWAIAFGALGVLLGMWWFRHKINAWYFYLGVPLALVENVIVLKALGF
ncbi:MAG: DUF1294 domain-containing protein [Candidatus Komeilibacteria bacterium]|nr:DUF1294 domain-containing protein [Candidatus Komeilibacteria bacterium]